MKARVLLADDHQLFTQALTLLLGTRYDVVDVVADGKALQVSARKHRPDVIVTDITMPLMTGLDAVRSLFGDGYTPKIIFLTMHADVELARECFSCGGSAFVSKDSSYDELTVAIDAVMSNQLFLSSKIAGGMVDALKEPASVKTDQHQLSLRQREILQLFAEGKTMKEIATITKLSTRTVEWHKYRMMRLLNVRRSAELFHYALKMKLVD
jgi:DNA-binding NarL/FixJ family response regulator